MQIHSNFFCILELFALSLLLLHSNTGITQERSATESSAKEEKTSETPSANEGTDFGAEHRRLLAEEKRLANEHQYVDAIKTSQKREALLLSRGKVADFRFALIHMLDDRAELQLLSGDITDAIKSLDRRLQLAEAEFGAKHWQTVNARIELDYYRKLEATDEATRIRMLSLKTQADAETAKGDFAGATATTVELNKVNESILGNEHPQFALGINNLGFLYYSLGDLKAAEPLYQEALKIREKTLGSEHPFCAATLEHLGALQSANKSHDVAESYYLRALKIKEQSYGLNDKNIAGTATNLAVLYYKQGAYDQALPLLERALSIREEKLGGEHLDTATSLDNLAGLYKAQENYAAAEPLYLRALQIRDKNLRRLADDAATVANASAAGIQAVPITAADRPSLVAQCGHSEGVTSVAFSPDGKSVLTGSSDDSARLWDLQTGKEVRQFIGHSDEVTSVAFPADGKSVLTGSEDFTARLWDAATGREVRQFIGHPEGVTSVAFSPDGKSVLTGSHDNTARLWDLQTGNEVRQFIGHSEGVSSVAFSRNGKWVLTGGNDNARLWDVATGKEIRQFIGHSETIVSVAFSPDEKSVLTGSFDYTARLWNVATGKEICQYTDYINLVGSVAFSPDGKSLLTGSSGKTAQLWNVATGKEIRRFTGHFSMVSSVAFSSDGKSVLTGSDDDTTRLWDVATGKEVQQFSGQADHVRSVAFSPDGKSVLTGTGHTARLWDLGSGKQTRQFTGHSYPVKPVAFSPDGKSVLTGSEDFTARLWDVATGREVRQFIGHSDCVESIAFSPDGTSVLTGSSDNTARLWNVATGNEVRQFIGHLEWVFSVAFSPDGKSVLTGSWDDTVRLWDVATGKEIRQFIVHSGTISSVAFSPDGELVLIGSTDPKARLFNVATGKEIRQFIGHSGFVNSVAFSPEGKRVLTGGNDKTARLWDVATGKEIRQFIGHSSDVKSVAFSRDGKYVLTGSWDNTARLWNSGTGEELCRLNSFSDGSWAAFDAVGRYDSSNGGDVDGLHWVIGNDPISLDQLKGRYYEPGLLAKIMGFNKEPLREVSAFTDPKLYPEVALTDPTPEKPVLGINLKNRGGGIGRVVVKINGKELAADARRPGSDPNAETLALEVDLRNDPRLKPGEPNEIEVQAFEAENYLRSRGIKFVYEPPGEKATAAPELWAIVAGVSDYRGDLIDLKYASKDAEDFATGLSIAAGRLFGVSKVHLTTLSTLQIDPASQPSRKQLETALEAARQAKPGDILVIYLAGHGVNYGGQDGDFYFLTSDASTAELTDPEVRRETTLSSNELTEYVKQIPALKQVLILDTCAAGRLVEKLTEKRDVPSSQIRALERVKDSTGLHVLAGCASDSVSYEATSYGQGLLTHSLLLGMRGAALRDEEYVDISKLFGFAADQVPQLAKDIGGIQRPVIAAPKGTSFDIGRVAGDDKARIPLQSVRPMILRANFQDAVKPRDVLGLALKVDSVLRQVSARGSQAPVLFVDTLEFPEAYLLSGRYQLVGDKISVEVLLSRGDVDVAQFTVTGDRESLEKLSETIVAEASRLLENKK